MKTKASASPRLTARQFVAKVWQCKTFALVAKINQYGRRAKIKLRLEQLPSPIMTSIDDAQGLKQFLINDGLLTPKDRLSLKLI